MVAHGVVDVFEAGGDGDVVDCLELDLDPVHDAALDEGEQVVVHVFYVGVEVAEDHGGALHEDVGGLRVEQLD